MSHKIITRRLEIKTYNDFDNFFLDFILPFVENAALHHLLKSWHFEKKDSENIQLIFKGDGSVIDNILIPELNQLHRDLWLYPLKNLSIQFQLFKPIEISGIQKSFLENEIEENKITGDFLEQLFFLTSVSMGGWLRTYLHHNIVERTSGVLLYYLGLIYILEETNEKRASILKKIYSENDLHLSINEHFHNALVVFGRRLMKLLKTDEQFAQKFYNVWLSSLRNHFSASIKEKKETLLDSKVEVCKIYKKYLINIFDLEQTIYENVIDKIALATLN